MTDANLGKKTISCFYLLLIFDYSFLIYNNQKIVDLLVNQEQSSSENRILALEKKLQIQADEILCLKSTLADVIRRLQNVESQQTTSRKKIKRVNFWII